MVRTSPPAEEGGNPITAFIAWFMEDPKERDARHKEHINRHAEAAAARGPGAFSKRGQRAPLIRSYNTPMHSIDYHRPPVQSSRARPRFVAISSENLVIQEANNWNAILAWSKKQKQAGPSEEAADGPSKEAADGPSKEAADGPSEEAADGPSEEAAEGA
ncbi:hypothetical protein M885DRAFT_564893 [Pelagophyceae sp. CCMP2097]|nr:hypothetical protein M885DRAFT_564893 [Pelagophyceae sp. CCMP2097]